MASYVGTHTTVVQSQEGPSSSDAQAAASAERTRNVAETLTLRLVPRRKKKSVKWSEEVIDNEFLGKKSSKKCCIFHKQRPFGEWSDDEDSDAECSDCKDPPDSQPAAPTA